MREYVNIWIDCKDEESAEILIAFLADYPFECFSTTPTERGTRIETYILPAEWQKCGDEAKAIISERGELVHDELLEDKNWNEQWEQESFSPVVVENLMVIRAASHEAPTDANLLDVVIAPSMSFGSGHHHTTRLMCRHIYDIKCSGSALDVGCGTGILSIVALKCGAAKADAIDIDPWSTASAQKGAELNGLERSMRVILGTVDAIAGQHYDLVMANINRNIILNDISHYVEALNRGGHLLLSGFLSDDVKAIIQAAEEHDLERVATLEEQGWVSLRLRKN